MQKQQTLSNGLKIRELREAASMTQEKLGLMSNVDRRTVQRAERGTRLQMETLSSLAAALNVPVAQIVVTDAMKENIDELNTKSLVVLNRIMSGMALLNIVRESYEGTIACDADPTPDNVEALTAVVGRLEALMPNPWTRPHDKIELLLSERIRDAVSIGGQLTELDGKGIAFFVGTYTARTQVPYFDPEEGEMYITNRTPYKLVTICKVVAAPSSRGDRITIKANDIYAPVKPPPLEAGEELQEQTNKDSEGIPF